MKSGIKDMIDIDIPQRTNPDSFLIQTGSISLEDKVSGVVEPIPLTAEQIADLTEMRESIQKMIDSDSTADKVKIKEQGLIGTKTDQLMKT